MFLDLQIRYRSVGPIPAIPAIPGTDFVLPGSGDGLVCLGLLGFLERHSGPRHRQGPHCGDRAVGTALWGPWDHGDLGNSSELSLLSNLSISVCRWNQVLSLSSSSVLYSTLYSLLILLQNPFRKATWPFHYFFSFLILFACHSCRRWCHFSCPASLEICVLCCCHVMEQAGKHLGQDSSGAVLWGSLGIFGVLVLFGFVGAFHNTTSAMCQLRTMSDMSGCTTRTSLSPFWSPVLLLVCLVAPWDLVEKCTTSTRLSSKRSQAGRPWCGSSKCSDCETILPAFDSRCRHWTFGRVQLGKRTFFQMLKCWIMGRNDTKCRSKMIPNEFHMNSKWYF